MILAKTISKQYQGCDIPGLVIQTSKKHHDLVKRAWPENFYWVHHGVNDTLDRCGTQRKSDDSQISEKRKDGNRIKSMLQGNEAVQLIASKTRGFRRSFSEHFTLKTVVKAYSDGESIATREEIIIDERSTAGVRMLEPDEFIYRPNAPNTRRKAICDEIEKCIIQNGGTLRSLRRDLVVAVNLTNWHLL